MRDLPADGRLLNDVHAPSEEDASRVGLDRSSLRDIAEDRADVSDEVRRRADYLRRKLESFGIRI
jgi:hypothetical protein